MGIIKKVNTPILTIILAAGLTLVCYLLNLGMYQLSGFIIGIGSSGGEIHVTYAIGLKLEEYYGLTAAEVTSASSELSFFLPGLIIGYIIMMVVAFLVVRKCKEE